MRSRLVPSWRLQSHIQPPSVPSHSTRLPVPLSSQCQQSRLAFPWNRSTTKERSIESRFQCTSSTIPEFWTKQTFPGKTHFGARLHTRLDHINWRCDPMRNRCTSSSSDKVAIVDLPKGFQRGRPCGTGTSNGRVSRKGKKSHNK